MAMLSRPKKLYKYLTADGARKLFSSQNPAIWFRLPNRLNDVYDIQPIGSFLDGFSSVASFCLSETPHSAPMWAHYASNGQGIVLEFSLASKFFYENPPVRVRYRKERPTIKDAYGALTIKNVEWAYEREWRCLTTLPQSYACEHRFLPSEQTITVPFPFEALTAVIHGYDSQVSAEEFLKRPEADHVKQLVCRTKAWDYGFNVCTVEDITHIVESREAFLWGRRQRIK